MLFLLAADAGVTKSDIEVWHDHISTGGGGSNRGRLVVLNKIDGLWDGLRDWNEVQSEIQRQIRETARQLNIDDSQIFPVSAQKALLGKIKGDERLLERSRIGALEDALANELVPSKREIVRENIAGDMTEILKGMRIVIMQRLKSVYEHMDELGGLNGKNMDVIDHMMKKVRVDKEYFEKSLQRFQATRSIFSKQTNILYAHLDLQALDKLIAATKRDMEISLTTAGLATGMNKFFTQVHRTMEQVTAQAQEIKELMKGVYKKFQDEHGLSSMKPGGFSVMKYLREIKRIESKNEQFLNGLNLFKTEQHTVVRKFLESVVAKVRTVYVLANRDADAWLKTIMSPMESQVREHQIQLRRRLESIKRIHQASDTLEDRLNELGHIRDGIREQEKALEAKAAHINRILDIAESAPDAIRLEGLG